MLDTISGCIQRRLQYISSSYKNGCAEEEYIPGTSRERRPQAERRLWENGMEGSFGAGTGKGIVSVSAQPPLRAFEIAGRPAEPKVVPRSIRPLLFLREDSRGRFLFLQEAAGAAALHFKEGESIL